MVKNSPKVLWTQHWIIQNPSSTSRDLTPESRKVTVSECPGCYLHDASASSYNILLCNRAKDPKIDVYPCLFTQEHNLFRDLRSLRYKQPVFNRNSVCTLPISGFQLKHDLIESADIHTNNNADVPRRLNLWPQLSDEDISLTFEVINYGSQHPKKTPR